MMGQPIPLIVPVLNRFDMFTEMMETVDTPVVPFVIDQWRNNRGVSGAWNLGMQRVLDAGYSHAVIANDDLKFTPGALRKFFDVLLTSEAALVSPNQLRRVNINRVLEDDIVVPGADFFCFGVDIAQLTENAGWFDENFFPAYFEDNDMHRRIILSGLKSYRDLGSIVIHEGSMTQRLDRNNPVTSPEHFEANRSYLTMKWGVDISKAGADAEAFKTPFNNPLLTVRNWNGSMKYDGLDTSPAQDILESIESVKFDVPMLYESM